MIAKIYDINERVVWINTNHVAAMKPSASVPDNYIIHMTHGTDIVVSAEGAEAIATNINAAQQGIDTMIDYRHRDILSALQGLNDTLSEGLGNISRRIGDRH